MNLATASRHGFPSSRIVLLKDFDEDGFVFYTNLESRKGNEIKENPRVALCFYWEPLDKQIRIEGNVRQVSDQTADEYFKSRPINSKIGATISKQSKTLNQDILDLRKQVEHAIRDSNQEIERPKFWSGFRIIPTKIEFWEDGGVSRLHKRVLFSRTDTNSAWKNNILYP